MQIHGMQNRCLEILFFNNPNKFFCDPKVFFLSMCIPLLEYLFEEIYTWVQTHFPKHQLVIEPWGKTVRKKVQRKSKAKLYAINS